MRTSARFANCVLPGRAGGAWPLALLFLYGVSVPLAGAAIHVANISLVFRDLAGFLFLCAALFYLPLLQSRDIYQKIYAGTLVICGLVFSGRVLGPIYGVLSTPEELMYLANSPVVLFTSLYLGAMTCIHLYSGPAVKNLTNAVLCFVFMCLPLAAMMLDVQRAGALSLGLTVVTLFFIGLWRRPGRIFFPLFIVAGLCLFFHSAIDHALYALFLKTARVGLNTRLQEFQAVLDAVSISPLSIFFGLGWGTTFHSPAVGGLEVNYTHSLLTYMWLKTGLVGVCLTLIYIGNLTWQMMKLTCRAPVKGLAVLWPVLIPVFFYASHKSLDFGLILLLASLWTGKTRFSGRVASDEARV